MRGNVVRMGERYTVGHAVDECSGEIPDHMLPSFWAMGSRVMVGLSGGKFKLTPEELERFTDRPPKTDRCSCGRKGVPSLRYENEVEACGLCRGAVCKSGVRNPFSGKRMKSGGVCCKCLDGALT